MVLKTVQDSDGLWKNHSFLLLFLGRLITNAGDSLYFIASMWIVFDLTGSTFYTGIAGFLVRAPAAFSVFIGPLVDRWPLRRILVGTQLLNSLLVLIIPIAHWMDRLSVGVILAVLPIVTFVNEFVYPVQNAALPSLVREQNLTKANSMLSAASKGVNTVFNALSGVLLAFIGVITMFTIDSITFGIALLLFAGITGHGRSKDIDRTDEKTDCSATEESTNPGEYLTQLREGYAYLRGSILLLLLVGVVLANFTAGAALSVLPALAKTLGGPDAFGFLMAAYAGGLLTGTLVAPFVNDISLGRFAAISHVVSGIMLAVSLALPWFPATLGFFFLVFLPIGAFNVLFSTMLQSAVEDEFLGRVTAFVRSITTVTVPVGSIVGGAMATIVNSKAVMFGWVIGSIAFGCYVALHPSLRSLPAILDIDATTLMLGDRTD